MKILGLIFGIFLISGIFCGISKVSLAQEARDQNSDETVSESEVEQEGDVADSHNPEWEDGATSRILCRE